MSKKPSRAKKATTAKPASSPDGESVWDAIVALVEKGYVEVVRSPDDADDAVFVAVPEELHAPREVDEETRSAEDRQLLEDGRLPQRVDRLLRTRALATWRVFVRYQLLPLIEKITRMPERKAADLLAKHGVDELGRDVFYDSIFEGFDFALERYATQLNRVPELAEWRRARRAGIDTGHVTQAKERERRYQLIRETWAAMDAAGEKTTNATVAAAVRKVGEKCSIRTVQRAFAAEPHKNKPAKATKR